MKPTFYQFNCREQNRPDYRQARAVLKYRPDIIIFEAPEKNGSPDVIFNRYVCDKKPKEEIKKIQNDLKRVSKEFGYVLSDVRTWQNIDSLWKMGHNTLLYNVDAPSELRSKWFEVWEHMYPCAAKNWLWWVRIYLRERIMANHIKNILRNYKEKSNPTILIFLQSFHWIHVKFLLTNPSKNEIWDYYFGDFREITRKNIAIKIKKMNSIFYKYWKKYSDV